MGKKKQWFEPQKKRGWSKSQSARTRRRKLLASTDGRKTMHNRYLEAARAIQALANVTQDAETRRKARADAEYFYKKARNT